MPQERRAGEVFRNEPSPLRKPINREMQECVTRRVNEQQGTGRAVSYFSALRRRGSESPRLSDDSTLRGVSTSVPREIQ